MARRPVRRRGRRRGRSPPAAHRAQGRGQDQHRRADPRHPARPHARGVARADGHPLARGRPRARGRDADPADVLGAAPRREQGQHRRRRQRTGAPRRDQPCALPGCCSSTSSRCSAPTSSRPCANPSRAARSPSPAARRRSPCRPAAWWCWPATRVPVGSIHPLPGLNRCTCREVQRRDYRQRITGPIADRIDITRHLVPLDPRQAADAFDPREGSATVRARVEAARSRQSARYADTAWRINGHVPGPVLRERWPLTEAAQRLLDTEVYAGRLSRRGATRVHRVAWTLADLAGRSRPGADGGRRRAAAAHRRRAAGRHVVAARRMSALRDGTAGPGGAEPAGRAR